MLKANVFPARIVGTRLLADVEFTANDKPIGRETYEVSGVNKLHAIVYQELVILRRTAKLQQAKAEIDAFVSASGVITLPDDAPSTPPESTPPETVADAVATATTE